MKQRAVIILFGILFLLPGASNGAEIYFNDSSSGQFGVDRLFEIGVFLDTKGESVNAVEAKILFPSYLALHEIRDGNSLLSLWLEKPNLSNPGEISFAGITPGGYDRDKGRLFSFILSSNEEGRITISSKGERVLLNDGEGSEALITKAPIALNIVKESLTPEFIEPEDANPPEIFPIHISQDATLFDNKWFLVFATQDKLSGIDHYEIFEKEQLGSIWGFKKTARWNVGESPYILSDQSLKSNISVKAIDRAGNERIATLPAQNGLALYENYFVWGIIIIVGAAFVLWKRRNLKK